MTMSAERVRQWLASTWHVKVPGEWLAACLDWLAQDNAGRSLSPSEVNRQVFEQWLLTDLRDMALPVLPMGMGEVLTTTLGGHYALQMDSLVDVSQPMYAQLQKLRGRDTSNEQVTAAPRPQQPWEVKAGRMLLLQLTDGVQAIQAMEYRPIPALHPLLPPGTKLLVSGRVPCRLGVLLLESAHVSLLGGEVEALVQENEPRRLLARLIGEPESAPTQQQDQQQQQHHQQDVHTQNGTSDADFPDDFPDDFSMDDFPDDYDLNLQGMAGNSPPTPQPPPPQPPPQPPPPQQRQQQQQYQQQRQQQQQPVVAEDPNAALGHEWAMDDWDTELEPEPVSLSAEPAGKTLREKRAPSRGTVEQVAPQHGRDVGVSAPERCGFAPLIKRPRPSLPPTVTSSSISSIGNISSSSSVGLHSPPFTYLSRVLSNRRPAHRIQITIKGFVVTLLGPLQTRRGVWSVPARITDGTAFTEATFSDRVLTQLIGFSVDKMKVLKRDPACVKTITQALEQCQRRLVDLCCLMELEFGAAEGREAEGEAGGEPPLLVRLEEVTREHVEQLRSRIGLL